MQPLYKKPLHKISTIKRNTRGGNTTANDMYKSAAEFGVFMAFIGLITAMFFGIIMIIIALYLIISNGTYSASTQATVVDSTCEIFKDDKNKTTKACNSTIKYNVNNKDYTNFVKTSTIKKIGAITEIVYDPNNPGASSQKTGMRRIFAYILIGFALFIMIAASIRYYVVKAVPFVAAASGIGEGTSMIASVASGIIPDE